MSPSGLDVVLVPILNDNYVFIIKGKGDECALVDPGVAGPVVAEVAARGWRVTHVLTTHWHGDHVGGVAEIAATTGCEVVGPERERDRISGITTLVSGGEALSLLGTVARVIAVPGHTLGHVAYHFAREGLLFVGDTLFGLGGGRLFEGSAADMFGSLGRLAALPDHTRVYCAHEYTQANGRFARTLAPTDEALLVRLAEIDGCRAKGQPTIPLTLGVERRTNPFLTAGSVDEYAHRRAAKDAFRG